MALSVADYMAWNFTDATTPLESIAGQVETWSLANGATVDTTNGIRLNTTNDIATLACTNGGDLVGWAYPYTFIFIGKRRTTGTSFENALLYRTAATFGMQITPNNTAQALRLRNGGTYYRTPNTNPTTDTLFIYIVEFRANGASAWLDNVSVLNETGSSLTMPTLSTGDTIVFGVNAAVTMDCDMHGCALVPGALTAQDRADLQADWEAALAPPTGPTISVQPSAQTSRLNGDTSVAVTMTAAATASTGNITGITVKKDGVAIADGGVYDLVTTGVGSSSSGTVTLTITPTDTTLTGSSFTVDFTDSNGTVTSDAAVLTVLEGPVLSSSTATTNGSGVASVTLVTDDSLTANGELLIVTATGRGGAVLGRTTLRPQDFSAATLSASTFALTADGVATTTLTGDVGTASGIPANFTAERTFVSAALSLVAASPGNIDSDGVDASTITVTVKNADGNPLPGIPAASVVVAVSGTGNTVTQPTNPTDENGQTTASFVSTGIATKTVSATVCGQAITDTASVVVGTATPLFSDDFESGDFTHTENGVAWETPDGSDAVAGTGGNGFFTRTSGTWAGDYTGIELYLQSVAGNANADAGLMGPYTVTSQDSTTLYFTGDATGAVQKQTHRAFVTNSFARNGSTYSVKFVFGPDPEEQDSRSQIPFTLPVEGRAELWLEYYLYVPSNYEHRSQSGGITNNKFAGIFARDQVADASRMLFDFETTANGTGGSNVFAQSVYSNGNISSGAVSVTGDTGYTGANYIGEVGSAVTLGAWNRFRIHIKSETADLAADGEMQLWVGNTKVFEATGRRFGYPFATGSAWYGTFPAVIDYGYLLGAANSGFTEHTVFYLDDLTMYDVDPGWTF